MASVRMLKTAAGPDGPFAAGQVYHDLHHDTAAAWMKAGVCVIVQDTPRTAVKEEPTPRRKDPPKWPMRMTPEAYLERYGDVGKHSPLAREIVG